ncbi:uncharacterized protein VTP21DRAFT_7180 [Calcarisporiella thermophila]|uniref:uncharacterized protein n=1 Tax=Calcarisporiella thermophila TaxID=911321 RepID=UPI0037440D0A
MDIQNMYHLFSATFNPDPNVRKRAELEIRKLEATPGLLALLLQILTSEESDPSVRQAVAIFFKNRLQKSWDPSKQGTNHPITEEDRHIIRENILQVLVLSSNQVRVQLTACLGMILATDYPNQWPTFLDQVQSMLTATEPRTVYVGLLALREVVKSYQWKVENREPLREIVKRLFPTLQQIASGLVKETSLDAAEMLKTSLKAYHSTIRYDLSTDQQDPASLIPWGTLFLQLVEKEIPTDWMPADADEREKYPWWKTKKWAFHCLNQLFSRYGNPALLPASNKKYKEFANGFIANFAPNILQAYLRQTELWIQKKIWISSKCLAMIASFYSDCVKHKTTWLALKPHVESLVGYFIFPQMCFTDEDQELWEEDPVEYVRLKVDPFDDFHSPIMNCTNLLMSLAQDRKKHTFMGILGFANSILSKYAESSPESRDPRQKDGALSIISCLCPVIMRRKSPVINMMESFFVNHVFPEFTSPHPFLRARACRMVRDFIDLEWKDENNLGAAYHGVMGCVQDQEIPVRVEALLALQPMTQHELVRNAMGPHLPQIMSELLKLTNDLDLDTLSSVTAEFVEVFSEQLTPFAVELCAQLRDTFLRIVEEMVSQGNSITEEDILSGKFDVDDKTMTAMGVLKTISTLLMSLESTPEVLHKLEETLLPVVVFTLKNQIIDLYDEIFEIIDCCTFATKRVSPQMWEVFMLIYSAFKESAIDFVEEMLPSLDNFIAFGKDVFVSSEDLQRKVYDIIETVMKSDRLGEKDRICGCKLMESVMLNCRGGVDAAIEPFLHLAFQHLAPNSIKTREFRIHCLEVVVNALYYNPSLTLGILERNQWTQGFFSMWFANFDKFARVHDKKLSIVAICAILETPTEHIPPTLQAAWPQILGGILTMFQSLPQAVEKRKRMEELFGDGVDDFENDDEGVDGIDDYEDRDSGDEDGDVHDADQEYLEFLAQEEAKKSIGDSQNEGDDEEEEEDLDEELMFESPLDEIDVYVRFQDVFRSLQQYQPASYTALTKDLSPEQQNCILSLFSTADENRRKQSEEVTA